MRALSELEIELVAGGYDEGYEDEGEGGGAGAGGKSNSTTKTKKPKKTEETMTEKVKEKAGETIVERVINDAIDWVKEKFNDNTNNSNTDKKESKGGMDEDWSRDYPTGGADKHDSTNTYQSSEWDENEYAG